MQVITIHSSICNNTLCVIVEGSGRVADIIAHVANTPHSRITVDLIKQKLKNVFQDSYNSFTETEISEWTEKIKDIIRKDSLLTILREERVRDQGMDVAILQALLKASCSKDSQENWDHQLKLAMSWNRPDIAETHFNEDKSWKPSDLHECLTLALIKNRPSFVRLFLERGVSLQEYLTRERLTHLYNNTDKSSLIHSKLKRLTAVQGSKTGTENEVELRHISHLLKELLGGSTETLYPDTNHYSLQVSNGHKNTQYGEEISRNRKRPL